MSSSSLLSTQYCQRSQFFNALLDAFEDGGDALPQSDAHRGHAKGTAVLLLDVQQGAGDTRSGATERMAQCDGAAMQVDLLVHLVEQLEILEHRQRLRSEGLVQFDVADVVHGQAGALERLLRGRH